MSYPTEKIIPGFLPPVEETEGIDFPAVYDSFDAGALTDEQLLKFASRYPSLSGVGGEEYYYEIGEDVYPVPWAPIGERLKTGQSLVKNIRDVIIRDVEKWKKGKKSGYKEARTDLIRAVGFKACTEYVRRQYIRMSEDQLREDQENWDRWMSLLDRKKAALKAWENHEYDALTEEDKRWIGERVEASPPEGYTADRKWYHNQDFIPVISLKLRALRKACGLVQKEFSKKIGCSLKKYSLLEQGKLDELGFDSLDEAFPPEFIMKVVDASGANPFWLEDHDGSLDAEADKARTAMTVKEARDRRKGYAMFAGPEVIRFWKSIRQEGSSRK